MLTHRGYFRCDTTGIEDRGYIHHYSCKHLNRQEGYCTIYDIRPQVCRIFPGSSGCQYKGCSTYNVCNGIKDYKFSYDRMLKFEGNTSTFLLYSYVRVMGIKRKIKGNVEEILKEGEISLEHPSEVSLGLCLRRFSEVVLAMEKDLPQLTPYLDP